jgi:hypothetical protein
MPVSAFGDTPVLADSGVQTTQAECRADVGVPAGQQVKQPQVTDGFDGFIVNPPPSPNSNRELPCLSSP